MWASRSIKLFMQAVYYRSYNKKYHTKDRFDGKCEVDV